MYSINYECLFFKKKTIIKTKVGSYRSVDLGV